MEADWQRKLSVALWVLSAGVVGVLLRAISAA